MKLYITVFVGLLLLGCNEPETEVEYWHVYAVPTSECHMYSDIPCEPETLPHTFKTEEEATEFARTQKNKRENVLWVKPDKAPKPIEKPDPIIKKNIIYKDVYVKPNSTELNNLKDTLQEKENIIVDLEKELITVNDCVAPTGKVIKDDSYIHLYNNQCQTTTRYCKNRVLGGDPSYKYESCDAATIAEPNPPPPPNSCEIYGSEDDHIRFDEPYVVYDDEYLCYEDGKKHYCRDGKMESNISGYDCRATLRLNKKPCLLDDKRIMHGRVELAYRIKNSEPWNYCSDDGNSNWRLCNNGILSGSSDFKYHNCNGSIYRKIEETVVEPEKAPVYSSQRTKKLEYHDYKKCLDITKHDYFPLTEPYKDIISLAPTDSKIYNSYPISECKKLCFKEYNIYRSEECHKCEIEAYPTYCYTKRFFYVPHNSRFNIKIDEL